MSTLSIIIPTYKEEEMIEKAASVIGGIVSTASIDCELIFVDDGSKDNTWTKLAAVSAINPVLVAFTSPKTLEKRRSWLG